MQDKDDKLDELYRNKLKDFKLPVSDKVLSNIKKELPLQNTKKKFGFGFWTLLIALFSGALTGGYFIASPYFTNKNKTVIYENNKLGIFMQPVAYLQYLFFAKTGIH